MSKSTEYPFATRIWLFYRWMYRRRGFAIRLLLCWGIALLAMTTDEMDHFDLRYQIRGPQETLSDVVLIQISPAEISSLFPARSSFARIARESADVTDGYYWSKPAWFSLLSQILQQDPKTIGVTFFFGTNIGRISLTSSEREVFTDPRIVWASRIDSMGIPQDPSFAVSYLGNSGVLHVQPDDDGVIRKFDPYPSNYPHFITLLSERSGGSTEYLSQEDSPLTINYRGGKGLYTTYTMSDVILDRIPPGAFIGKTVIIGADTISGGQLVTPLGTLTRADLTAQLLDNTVTNSWVRYLPVSFYHLFLFSLAIVFILVIYRYPQSIALTLCIWLGLMIAAFSAFVFDNYNIWIPMVSPLILLTGTWVIFVGYRANVVEQSNWRLRQEQRYHRQLEQLKNNFISLISHDLKTPIAKIQAIADRLANDQANTPIRDDLKSIRKAGDELHRYIQSILGILRVESRNFKIHREIADVNSVIEEAYDQLSELAWEKQITLEKSLEPMFTTEFDVTLIKEVVVNLLDNAIKYTPEGGRVEITSQERDGFIEVEVTDTGEGIPEKELESVWGKFVRGKDQDMKSKGTGLGLYLVRYFVELHGGTTSMISRVGEGTRVKFTLPVDVASAKAE